MVASLEEAGEECQSLSLRTTNDIERMQQEFRRRVKTQAVPPSESAFLRVFEGRGAGDRASWDAAGAITILEVKKRTIRLMGFGLATLRTA